MIDDLGLLSMTLRYSFGVFLGGSLKFLSRLRIEGKRRKGKDRYK